MVSKNAINDMYCVVFVVIYIFEYGFPIPAQSNILLSSGNSGLSLLGYGLFSGSLKCVFISFNTALKKKKKTFCN